MAKEESMMLVEGFSSADVLVLMGGICLIELAIIIYLYVGKLKAEIKLSRQSNLNTQLKADILAHQTADKEQIRELKKYDQLTGLYNRPFFLEEIAEILKQAEKTQEKVVLYLVNLDNFKDINEQIGPKSGDQLLQEVAYRLSHIGPQDHIHLAHLGADEFAVLVEKAKSSTNVCRAFANQLMNKIHGESISIDGRTLTVSVSIGIAIYPDSALTNEEMLQHADIALHHAKQLGKGESSFFTDEMRDHAKARLDMVNELRVAIQENQLELFYQPKVLTQSRKIYGAEALVRWNHPTKGYISPEIFVPVAEKSGLIGPIGEWIIKTACQQTAQIQAQGYPDLTVAINLSANQFNKGDVAGIIAHEIWMTGLKPSTVELELTETLIMGNPEKSILMLRVLKAMKVKLAVDDFGTGYSSLSQLKQFPIDTLKIDQSFIKNLHKEPENQAIVSTITMMGKKLGLKLVAEGVECQEEFEILKKEGVDLIQGFFFSKPLPFDEYFKAIQRNRQQNT